MKQLILGFTAAIAFGSLVAFGAGEGASQKWVNYRIAQSETNTLTTVSNQMVRLDSQLRAAINASIGELMAATNSTQISNAVQKVVSTSTTEGMAYDNLVDILGGRN